MTDFHTSLNEALARTRPAGEDVEAQMRDMLVVRFPSWKDYEYDEFIDRIEGIYAAHDAQVAAAAEPAAGERIAAAILRETCREWPKDGDRCNAPAEFILWGKLFPPEALGPRCFDHAVKHAGDDMTRRTDQWAVFDLRVQSVLARIARADRGSDRG